MMLQQYPDEQHVRKHGPKGLAAYRSYKPWLRDDFSFRCVYCLERERWYPNRHHGFGVDHVKAKSVPAFSHLECDYDNLVYACNRCNTAKGVAELIDPTTTAFRDHLKICDDGNIFGLSDSGEELILILGLDEPNLINTRSTYISIMKLFEKYPEDEDVINLYADAFGFPDDLPDLANSQPAPKENSKPEGITECFHAQRMNKTLPTTYLW